jgi:hypothetical protein
MKGGSSRLPEWRTQLTAALERIGWGNTQGGDFKRRRDEIQARWLFNFARQDLTNLSTEEWRNLSWEVEAFITGPVHLAEDSIPRPPSPVQVRAQWRWLSRVFADLREGKRVTISQGGYPGFLQMRGRSGFLTAWTEFWNIPWPDSFRTAVRATLTSQDALRRFRFCPECRHPFLTKKRQRYCGPKCSQTFRTRKFRTEKREQFRTWRRQAYRRKIQERLGRNVRIESRRTKEP